MKNQNKIYPFLAILIISSISYAILYLISILFTKINSSLTSNYSNYISLSIFIIISFIYLAFYFSGLLGIIKDTIQNKFKVTKYFSHSKQFFIRILLTIIIIYISYKAIQSITQLSAFYIGRLFSLSLSSAIILFYVIYFSLMAIVFIFLTYLPFVIVLKDIPFKKSFKEGVKIIRKEYVFTLSILILYYILSSLISTYIPLYSDIIDYILFIPLFSIIFMYKASSYYNDIQSR